MSAARVLEQARAAGVTLWAEGDALRYRGPREALAKLLPELREHKAALLEALAHPDPAALWWRIAILEPGGRVIEVDSPSGFTMAEWQAYADRYYVPGCVVTPIAGLPKPRAPVPLGEVLAAACEGQGITPAEFRGLLSREDLDDVASGAIHPKTLKAYAASFAEGIAEGRIVVPGGKP